MDLCYLNVEKLKAFKKGKKDLIIEFVGVSYGEGEEGEEVTRFFLINGKHDARINHLKIYLTPVGEDLNYLRSAVMHAIKEKQPWTKKLWD